MLEFFAILLVVAVVLLYSIYKNTSPEHKIKREEREKRQQERWQNFIYPPKGEREKNIDAVYDRIVSEWVKQHGISTLTDGKREELREKATTMAEEKKDTLF